MKFAFNLYLLILLCCFQISAQDKYLGIQKTEIELVANRHLNEWFPLIVDKKNGGYFTSLERDLTISNMQSKMLVTQARALWTSSKAAQMVSKPDEFIKAANHGYHFITEKMWDAKIGGFKLYYFNDNSGEETPYKLIYANAFALFALSEYARITPSDQVFEWINKSFDWIDSVAHDDDLLGYYNFILDEKLKQDTPENKKYIKKISWGNVNWKDQNTSIHLLEAFTSCYQVLPVEKVEKRLKEMLSLVRDTMTQTNGSLKLNFTKNWDPINYTDSTKNFILKNIANDNISFGHNIETAYLIIDASKALYGMVDSKTLSVAKKMTDHTLKNGFAPDFYGLFDIGYKFKEDKKTKIIDSRKTWWSQFEALHTLALISAYYPNDKIYPLAFEKMWKYIQNELYDNSYGGFYNSGLDQSPKNKQDLKGHNWKGPYHDGRALMMVWQYSIGNQ